MPASGEGRTVVVTGGGRGIGEAITETFLAQGCRVAVLDNDLEALGRHAARDTGGMLLTVGTDVADEASVAEAFGRLDREWDGIDVLCSNAGISIRRDVLDTSAAEWNRVLAVNLTGAFHTGRQAALRMHARGRGVIVNTASVSGLVGMPQYAAYNASKAGLIELTRTMALELAPTVRVNAVCPGYVLTPMQESEYTPHMLAECAAAIPLGRLGTPREIAGLVSYLASDDAAFITGQSFVIDGGESAGGLASAV
ncbi:SDR family NAD(P)-dependent oxidoreductase [Streptomyces sp. SAS_281]|uniref:SDR family NAD(P)-dependent oxidoreductase n=1 Tax=Streptomyces sp. SAS_281 TaxID=3412744 RepID=UPI00403C79C8